MQADAETHVLAEDGQRDTRQRRALRERLEESGSFVSAQQLHDRLRDSGEKVGLATVYRNLQTMVHKGEVDVVRIDEGETRYRKCNPRHHHHLVCRRCGLAVELDGPAVEKWALSAAQENGFHEVEHVIELFGVCADCFANAG